MSDPIQQENASSDLNHAQVETTSLPSLENSQGSPLTAKNPDPPDTVLSQVEITPTQSIDTLPETTSNTSDSPKELLSDSDSDTKLVSGIYLRSQKPKLECPGTLCSRTGEAYQVTSLPEAGSYKKEKRDTSVMPQKMWDPVRAKRMGLDDFVQLYCPKNKKEVAMTLLHRRNYKITGFLEALEEIPPTDGSEWTEEEHNNFLSLLQKNKYNFNKAAKAMGKSVSNCMTVYYNVINVRKTRSRKRKTSSDQKEESQTDGIEKAEKVQIVSDSQIDESLKRNMSSDTDTDETSSETEMSQDQTNNQTNSTRRRSKRIKVPSDEEKNTQTRLNENVLKKKRSGTNNRSSEKKKSSQVKPLGSENRRSTRSGLTLSSSSSSNLADTGMKKRTKAEPRKLPTRKVSAGKKEASAKKAASAKSNDQDKSYLNTSNTTAQDDQWEKTLKSLIKFKEENGHCLVPKIHPENQNLSYWVFRQRG